MDDIYTMLIMCYAIIYHHNIRGNMCDVLAILLQNVCIKRNKDKKQEFCSLYWKSICIMVH